MADLSAYGLGDVQHLTSASVSDARKQHCSLPARIKALSSTFTVIGPALPARCPVGDNLWIHRAVNSSTPGEVLVIAIEGDGEIAYLGELMARSARGRGVAGVVIDGGVRDRTSIVELGFPVFSNGVFPRAAAHVNDHLPGSVGTPVVIGSQLVCRGDLVVGDDDGIVVIPTDAVADVVQGVLSYERTERDAFARVEAGERPVDIFGLSDLTSR